MQARPTIEQLDQLFANQFGVNTVVATPSGRHFDATESRSAMSNSSRASTESGNSPRTPANLTLDLAPIMAATKNSMDENERMVKVNSLLHALAELYAAPTTATAPLNIPKTQKNGKPMIQQDMIEEQIEQIEDHEEEVDHAYGTSPKSSVRSSPSRSAAQTQTHTVSEQGSNRTSSSSVASLRGGDKIPAARSRKIEGEGEEAAIWPVDDSALYEVSKAEDVGIVTARRPSKVSTNEVRPMGPLTQIHFSVDAIPRRAHSDSDCRDELVRSFPALCEAPHTLMFDDQGVPLPPLKYEETTNDERKARKEALTVRVRGKKMHTLVKSMVVVESRSTHWKKIGTQASSKRSSDVAGKRHIMPSVNSLVRGSSRNATPRLPDLPSPWNISFMHSDSDTLSIRGTARRIFELSESRAYGQCPKCNGAGEDACATCKGAAPDECFWCDGSGREKRKHNQACNPCAGTGKLQCRSCSGSLLSSCRTCNGEGRGEFCAYVQIKVRRVDFAPVHVTAIVPSGNAHDQDAVRAAAVERTWDSINKLTEASKSKHKHPFRPLAASCSCQTSWSDLVEVEVPQAPKVMSKPSSSSASGLLKRSRSMNNTKNADSILKKAPTKKHYFVMPSDTDLQPAEIDEDEFELALTPDIRVNANPSSAKPVHTRPVNMSHQRSQSHSARTYHDPNQAVAAPSSGAIGASYGQQYEQRPAPRGIHPSEVAAWQAQLHRMIPANQSIFAPDTQASSLPSTPDLRARMADGNYFSVHAVNDDGRAPAYYGSPRPLHSQVMINNAASTQRRPMNTTGHSPASSVGSVRMVTRTFSNN